MGDLDNYRDEFIYSNLLLQAVQKRFLKDNDSPADRAFSSAASGLSTWKWFCRIGPLASAIGFNVVYAIPRFNQVGAFATLVGNLSIFGTWYYLTKPVCEGKTAKARALAVPLLEKHRSQLDQLRAEQKIYFQWEPVEYAYPPVAGFGREKEDARLEEVWRQKNQHKGTLYESMNSFYVRYPEGNQGPSFFTPESADHRYDKGYTREQWI